MPGVVWASMVGVGVSIPAKPVEDLELRHGSRALDRERQRASGRRPRRRRRLGPIIRNRPPSVSSTYTWHRRTHARKRPLTYAFRASSNAFHRSLATKEQPSGLRVDAVVDDQAGTGGTGLPGLEVGFVDPLEDLVVGGVSHGSDPGSGPPASGRRRKAGLETPLTA